MGPGNSREQTERHASRPVAAGPERAAGSAFPWIRSEGYVRSIVAIEPNLVRPVVPTGLPHTWPQSRWRRQESVECRGAPRAKVESHHRQLVDAPWGRAHDTMDCTADEFRQRSVVPEVDRGAARARL